MKRISLALAAVIVVAVPVTAATTAGASTKLRVFFPNDCQHNKYKPKSFVVTCADANFTVKKVKYSAYGATSAKGTGTASLNTCEPDCASGTFKSYPVKLTLSRVKQCGDVPQFTRARITFTGARPAGQSKSLSQPFTCAIPPTR
jgi:hypothetical protein